MLTIDYKGKRYTPSSTAKEIYASDLIDVLINDRILEEIKEEKQETKYQEAKRKGAIARAKAEQQIKDHDQALDETHGVVDVVDKIVTDENGVKYKLTYLG